MKLAQWERKLLSCMCAVLAWVLVAVVLAACSRDARAGDWTGTDSAWQAAYLTTLAIDCAQTRWVAAHPGTFTETDRFLGERPSKGRINSVCAGYGIFNTTVSYLLPAPWRRAWQVSTIAIELHFIRNNWSAGIGMQF